jgi:TRAP-type C4-dicarboxylate transport system permease small subunit
MLDRATSIIRRIGGAGAAVGATSLLAVMLLIMANIIYRFFGGVIAGTYELIGPMVVITAAFALAYTALHHGHIAINIITSRLPGHVQAIVQSFTGTIGFGLWILIAWGSVKLMAEKASAGEATYLLHVPFLPFRLFWELGLILFCLVLLLDLFKALSQVIRK